MRSTIAVLLCGLACLGGSVRAQPSHPALSPEDFAKAIQEAPCDDGQARDNGGVCRPAGTRGFNLGARSHTAAATAQAKHGGAAPARKSSMLDDLRITFRSGAADMTPEGEAEAKNFAAALTMPWLAKRRFEIAGHTDASGSRKKNLALSQARANAVLELLVASGVDRARLEARGYGSEDLAVPSAPRDAANRRVEARSLN